MKKFLLVIGKYGLLFYLLANGIAYLSLYFLSKSCFYKPQFVANGNVNRNYHYVVLGSSTGLTTLDTKLIDSLTGYKGLNISMDDSGLGSHYLMLQHFFKNGNTTNVLILAVTPWDMANKAPEMNENDYRFLPNINEDFVYEYFSNFTSNSSRINKFSRWVPILGLSYYNLELFYPSFITLIRPSHRNRFDEKGNYSYPLLGNVEKQANKKMVSEVNNPFFEKIKFFCSQNNIKLIVYQSPMHNTEIEWPQTNINVINHSSLLKEDSLFYDQIHVNKIGRKICSEYISEFLKDKLN